ncbi:hypothetical protein D3C81_170220 [compost metagenome]
MTDETNTLEQGGGEALPQETTKPAYVDDVAEAQPAKPEPVAEPEKDDGKKRNRTREYIQGLQKRAGEVETLRAELEQLKSRFKEPDKKEPKPEDFDFDPHAYARAAARWEIDQEKASQTETESKRAEAQRQSEAVAAYQQRAAEFAVDHEDFDEVVSSIPAELLPKELQAAIMVHPRGAEIAYQLALNEDELFNIAALRPELMPRAIERYALRMSEAPKGEPAQPEIPALAQAPQKPITQAPAPAPRVGGRAVTEVPSDKQTDDEWYRDARAKG